MTACCHTRNGVMISGVDRISSSKTSHLNCLRPTFSKTRSKNRGVVSVSHVLKLKRPLGGEFNEEDIFVLEF